MTDERRVERTGGPRWVAGLAAVVAIVCVTAAVVSVVRVMSPPAEEVPPRLAQMPATGNAQIAGWLAEAVDEVATDGPGRWRFVVADRPVMVLTDEAAGRMRIISPVGAVPADGAELNRLLEANFHSALDARYAIWEGQLWCAFIHPLPSLTQGDFYNGVGQVVTLAITTGTTYSSSGLHFGGDEEPTGGPGPSGAL